MQPEAWPEPDPLVAAAIAARYRGKRQRPLAVQIRDRLGQWLTDDEFADVFGIRGKPGWSPSRLALVTVLQRAEKPTGRAAADAVRNHLDWQYLLGLALGDPGSGDSVLPEFRARVAEGGLEQVVLDRLLERLAADGLVKPGGKQRTDSTHVEAAVASLNRLELAGESARAVLEALPAAHPHWLEQRICVPDFTRRHGTPMTSWRPPVSQKKRDELALAYARDGYGLPEAVYHPSSPAWPRELPAVDVLRQVLAQNYTRTVTGDGREVIKRREKAPEGDGLPPGHLKIASPDGTTVEPVTEFFRDLLAAGRSEATVRSYGMDLLRWFRFTWAAGIAWDRAGQRDARDFSRWLLLSGQDGKGYAPAVRVHSETVLRGFYAYHLEAGTGPVINPFPLDRARRRGRPGAHHNPMENYPGQRSGRYRPRLPSRVPRAVSDEEFNAIFARLPSNRDRALVAFYVSTGARASELLSATAGGTDPGRQLITVVRKGTRELAQLPASPDAFVWLRLYQAEMGPLIPAGRRQPLWWTLRRPVRPLSYHAAHRMFERVNQQAGTAATLHALRHTAAFRMTDDPSLPLTDVQVVLGHAQLTTTQIYTTPRTEDVIRRVLAHHGETERQAAARSAPVPASGYRPETLGVLFGTGAS